MEPKMAIFDEPEVVKSPTSPNPNLVRPTETIAVSNKHQSYSNLIVHAEGFKWRVVAYYSQYLTSDMEPAALALNRDPVYQQYLRIEGLEMRVESPLSPSQDAEGKEFTVTGSSILYPGVVANRYDFFIAEVADGRLAIIEVTDVEEPTLFKDTVMRINYQIRDYLDPILEENIKSKVVSEKVYVTEFFNYGKNPVIAQADYNTYLQLKDTITSLTDNHFKRFNDPEYNNLTLPEQTVPIIDLKFSKFVSTYLHGKYDSIYRQMAADAASDNNEANLWDLLETGDRSLYLTMSYSNRTYSVQSLNWHPVISPIRYAGYDFIYGPLATDETYDPSENYVVPAEPRVFRRNFDPMELCSTTFAGLTYLDVDAVSIPPFNVTGADEGYVFSMSFYNDVPNEMSLLERLVTDALEGKSVDPRLLLGLGEVIIYQDALTMFYQIPVLIWLMERAMEKI